MRERQTSNLDFFNGGVPAGTILQLELGRISDLLKKNKESDRKLAELAFIGATSQFEAFWKDSFASLLNISPSLLGRLKAAGADVRIDSELVLEFGEDFWHSVGFLVTEKMDFGSAQKINSAFSILFKITPFGKANKKTYDQILADRNLLVHHGGIYTTSYLKQNLPEYPNRAFMDTLVIDRNFVSERIAFFKKMAQKLIESSKKSMEALIQSGEIEIDKAGQKALSLYDWWDPDDHQ